MLKILLAKDQDIISQSNIEAYYIAPHALNSLSTCPTTQLTDQCCKSGTILFVLYAINTKHKNVK